MDMTGEHRIPAPRHRVWEALNDPAILQQCIPGCEEIERTTPTEWAAKVRAKVGPVSAAFKGKVTLSELDPPNGYRITGEGTGGAAGFAKGGALVRLSEDGDATLLAYTVNAQVGGKLAQIGSRLIDGTARKMADEFFTRFASIVGEAQAAPPPEAPAAPSPIEPGLEATAADAVVAEGNIPHVPGEARAPREGPSPIAPTHVPPAETRGSLPPWVWIVGVAILVAVLLGIFAL
ncbi:MAG: carbon monoxide dehydrogenase subunit G [Rhodospirillales bacterium]|nr:carbon monoxide dehydrogenase subunit G [Rhodospirillales bacterium]